MLQYGNLKVLKKFTKIRMRNNQNLPNGWLGNRGSRDEKSSLRLSRAITFLSSRMNIINLYYQILQTNRLSLTTGFMTHFVGMRPRQVSVSLQSMVYIVNSATYMAYFHSSYGQIITYTQA